MPGCELGPSGMLPGWELGPMGTLPPRGVPGLEPCGLSEPGPVGIVMPAVETGIWPPGPGMLPGPIGPPGPMGPPIEDIGPDMPIGGPMWPIGGPCLPMGPLGTMSIGP